MQSVPSTLSPPSGGRTLRRVLILLFAGLLTIGMLQPTAAHPGYGGHAKLWVKDTSVVEPDTGTTYAKVKIVLKSKHYKAEHHAKGKRGKVKIYFKTVDGSATAGEDYTAVRGKGYLPLSKKRHVVAYLKVPVLGDTIDEPDEYFKVLVKARGAKVKDGVGVVTIVDNDEAAPPPPPEKPQLVVRDLKVDEGKVADFQIWLSAPAPEGLTFDYATVDAAAKAGQDYVAKTGNDVLIPKGATGFTVSVPTIQDTVDEPDEDFLLRVSDVKNATVLKAQGRAVILDDDVAKPSLTIKDVQVEEGKRAVLEVHLSAASTETVAVDFKTYDGSATQGEDYTATTGTLYFTAGVTVRRIAVDTLEDLKVEGTEKFGVLLTNPRNATIADGQGKVEILDDDVAKPSLTIKDVQVEEGKRAVLEVHLSAASTETVAVDFKTYDGSATQGEDYTATTGTLYFTAGVTVRRIAVDTLEDLKVEGTEKFGVLLTNPRNATIADGQGKVEILDDDS